MSKGNKIKKGKSKRSIIARKISKSIDMPFDGVASSFRIELHGDAEALISGCEQIIEYDPSHIKLRLKGRNIEISGSGLECMTYLDGTVDIKGIISDLKFGEETGV